MDKAAKRLGRRMLAVYRETDDVAASRAESAGATCRKGCSDCCHLLVSVTLPEAVAVAEEVLTNPALADLRETLAETLRGQAAAIKACGGRSGSYFQTRTPCAFLDVERSTCRIYAKRPSACRLHYVASDPAQCSPGVTGTVAKVNVADLAAYHTREGANVAREVGVPALAGPFPIVLMWALKLLTEGRDAFAGFATSAGR